MAHERSASASRLRRASQLSRLSCALPILALLIAACGHPTPSDRDTPKPENTLEPAKLTVALAGPTGIDVGSDISLKGSTSANLRGTTVNLQRRGDEGWTTVATAPVSNQGKFKIVTPASVEGRRQQFRVEAPKTATTREAVSAKLTFSVFADPANRAYTFQDDFDGTSLDPQKWATRHQAPSARRMCAQPSDDMVAVSDGTALLMVRMKPHSKSKTCPHGVWDNAMISTQGGTTPFAATYGVVSARIRFQSSTGMHGSFWLQGAPVTGAEIDVAEYFGDGRSDGGLTTFVHYTDSEGKSSTSGGIRRIGKLVPGADESLSQSWHVYSVEWDPTGYIFRIDGYPTLMTAKPKVASSPEILILSLLTSDWELPAMKDPTSTMEVDWVRAWN